MREVLDRIGDTWSVLVIINLKAQPPASMRCGARIEGISQRMLTVTLRSLERDGLVSRAVRPTTPPEVEYSLTELGHSLASTAGRARHTGRRKTALRMRKARAEFDAGA